ncbi:MAG: hypothetical protein OXC13_18155 [Caldilineaceae bacterium]|nr:hypothetical protein [Caldilineaceae bacterium]
MTTDDDPVYGSALKATGLDRQLCAMHLRRTVGRHIRHLDKDSLTHLDRTVLPILQWLVRARPLAAESVLVALWEAVMAHIMA